MSEMKKYLAFHFILIQLSRLAYEITQKDKLSTFACQLFSGKGEHIVDGE
jgi:hypothetical protein